MSGAISRVKQNGYAFDAAPVTGIAATETVKQHGYAFGADPIVYTEAVKQNGYALDAAPVSIEAVKRNMRGRARSSEAE